MLFHSNHLQVSANKMAFVFDCTDLEPRLINSMVKMGEYKDPESFVECGVIVYDDTIAKFVVELIPNPQGSMIVKRRVNQDSELEEDS